MQTLSHLALQPAVNARPMGGFEQTLAQASLRRVEAKEFVFAEADPTMTRADTGDFLSLTVETVSRTFTKLKTLGLIERPQSNRVKLIDIDELKSLADGEDHEDSMRT